MNYHDTVPTAGGLYLIDRNEALFLRDGQWTGNGGTSVDDVERFLPLLGPLPETDDAMLASSSVIHNNIWKICFKQQPTNWARSGLQHCPAFADSPYKQHCSSSFPTILCKHDSSSYLCVQALFSRVSCTRCPSFLSGVCLCVQVSSNSKHIVALVSEHCNTFHSPS